MRYLYGPVESRRLGLSLGVSLTPYKICDFDCLYCQLGPTKECTNQRKVYVPKDDILAEIRSWIETNPYALKALQYVTISGMGEPTLHAELGELIREIKQLIKVPLAVITNASLLDDPTVRNSLLQADLLVPSLDAVTQDVFERVDRPHSTIQVDNIIQGLVALRKEFKGKIWLEVMLVSGINDDIRYIKKLKEVVDTINPDQVQLNSPVRTTAEENISPVDKSKLEKIREILGDKAQII